MMRIDTIMMERKLAEYNSGLKNPFEDPCSPKRQKIVKIRGQNFDLFKTPLQAIKE